MAKTDRFLVAPINSGLQNDIKPWLIPDDAFEQLNNAYVFRGRVRKRFGSDLMGLTQLVSRLRVQVGTTDGAGNLAGNVPGLIYKIGQLFSIGNSLFTVTTAGNPANLLRSDGLVAVATYSTTTGAFNIQGSLAATPVFFYPAEPVMGLLTYEQIAINNEQTIAFDTQFAYTFNNGWSRLGTAAWTGNNSQFFWPANYRGTAASDNIFFVTNFNEPDVIKYWDGATWTNFTPAYIAGSNILSARLIVPFQDRLIFLNTIEQVGGNPVNFPTRVRYSQNGSPLQADAWREDIVGKGGFLDAPTKEAIITVEFLKDRLIVFFESSTWELVYTSNQVLPFSWQKINTELGAESTFSIVPFDKVCIGVGNVGIHACNGINVERIDDKIPDSVFDIQNKAEGVQRVYGIRDYWTEMVYWAFPAEESSAAAGIFPNRVLVYNYKNGAWAFNDDSITCFGYFSRQIGRTWANTLFTWQEANFAWNSATSQSQFREILAGNQEGFVFILDTEQTRNAPSLQVTNYNLTDRNVTLTIIDHNLEVGQYVILENFIGINNINDNIYMVFDTPTSNTIVVQIPLDEPLPTGTYLGGGTVARVSNINILTKQFNFYNQAGVNAAINKVDFLVDKTEDGEVTVNYYLSSSLFDTIQDSSQTGALLGNGSLQTFPYDLYPLEQQQVRLWHPVYIQAEGEIIQLRIGMSAAQLTDPEIAFSEFELHAFCIYATPTSRFQ